MTESLSSNSLEDCDSMEDYPQLNDDLSMPGSEKQLINVLVTGFGPFQGHEEVNPSWEAVKELKKLGVAHNVNLVTVEVPVEYQHVQKHIPLLWKEYRPVLVVHVGVSSIAKEVTIETCAHNDGYKNLDVAGKCAPSQCYKTNGKECINTGLNVSKLCADVNESSCLAMAVPSSDAGRYLCDFIYYASLNEDRSKVIFVHVPPLDEPYTAAELGHSLKMVVISMMKQLNLYRPLPLPNPDLMNQLAQLNDRGYEAVSGDT